uniref:PGG domain-containing protein n=1 Tax=Oryza glumipatula TaxID=40148 RepID=A0A0E0B0Z0_9ORYZ
MNAIPAAPATMNPKLLMAARHGDIETLKRLLAVNTAQPPPQVVLQVDRPAAAAPSAAANTLLEGVTSEGDSALHVVAAAAVAAACGDDDDDVFLDCAGVIHGAARHLIRARNSNGDTPLHRASRAGSVNMVRRLIAMAKDEAGDDDHDDHDDGGERRRQRAAVELLLRAQNKRGETALHEAIRSNSRDLVVDELLSHDPELARVPGEEGGTSPLYLAISLRRFEVAKKLHERDEQLSYSGPQGRNALHVAVLIGKGPTEMILGWNGGLAKQGDEKGRTPLHFAASTNRLSMRAMVKLLLEHDRSCVYQPDEEGSYPIHVAAALGGVAGLFAVKLMIEFCPDCAGLRDGTGRSFLHVAVDNLCPSVVALARFSPGLRSAVMNMQDENGNTALHQAVHVCDIMIFFFLLIDRRVLLDVKNNMGVNEKRVEKEERGELSMIYKDAAQNLTIGAVLIVTVTFAATFTMPGGYVSSSDDDGERRGTPTLAGTYAFDAFVAANTLAFMLSGMATFSLMYAGYTPLDFAFRERCVKLSMGLLHSSVRSVGAAFLTATYVMLARVAPKLVVAVYVAAAVGLFYINFEVWMLGWMTLALLSRGDILAALIVGLQTVAVAFWFSWPFAVIFVLPLILKGQ